MTDGYLFHDAVPVGSSPPHPIDTLGESEFRFFFPSLFSPGVGKRAPYLPLSNIDLWYRYSR